MESSLTRRKKTRIEFPGVDPRGYTAWCSGGRPCPPRLVVGPRCAGFTLIELMIVMFIMAILIAIAIPNYESSVRRARESVLRQDLYDMRKLISEYTLDKQKAPQSLDDLVQANYLKPIPTDPITRQPDWQTEQCDDSTVMSPDEQDQGGICDVHSSSTLIGSDGAAYNTW